MSDGLPAVAGSYLGRWSERRPLPGSRVVCAAPFVTMEFGPAGLVQTCCANALFPVGDVRRQSLREIWEGRRMGLLRESLASGDVGPGCGVCRYRLEHTPGELPRDYYDQFGYSGGPVPEWPSILTFSLHNTCNLQCVMCGADESSTIRSRRDHLPALPHVYDDRFFEELVPFLERCDFADFIGGEPFLVREHQRVWDLLMGMDRPVRCSATTNGTVWNARVEELLDRLDFQLTVSVDGVTRETFESIRVGASFDEVYRNIERFRRYTAERGRPFGLSWSLVRQNAHEFPAMLRWAEEREIPVKVQTVMEPDFGVQALPTEELRRVVEAYRQEDPLLSAELSLNEPMWRRELRRLEDELASRSGPPARARQMRPAEFGNARHVLATVLDGPDGPPAAPVPEDAEALLAPWRDGGEPVVELVLDRTGLLVGGDDPGILAGDLPDPGPSGRRLDELLTVLAAPFGGGIWISEEFVGPEVVEHVLLLGRQVRDKSGLVLRLVSWVLPDGVVVQLVASEVLLGAWPVRPVAVAAPVPRHGAPRVP